MNWRYPHQRPPIWNGMEGLFTGDLGRRGRDSSPIFFTGRKGDYCKRSGKRFTIGEMESAVEKAVGRARVRPPDPQAGLPGDETTKTAGLPGVKPNVRACCIEANGEFDVFVSGICDQDVGLKSICVKELPSHLVPSRFHKISTIPVTGNGKVDREKLRAMANNRGGRYWYW